MTDKIEIEIDRKVPPGILFSTVSTGYFTSHELYALEKGKFRRYDVWNPVAGGYIPGYEAALFLRLLSELRSSITGRKDTTIGDKWRGCLSPPCYSDQAVCMVGGDMLEKVIDTIAKVAVLGISGFFLRDLVYLLYVSSRSTRCNPADIVTAHAEWSAISLSSYLGDVKLRDVTLACENDSANFIMYKVCKFIAACTSEKDYKAPIYVPTPRTLCMPKDVCDKLESTEAVEDEPPCKFATDTFDSIPVIKSDADEASIMANIPAEFAKAAGPIIQSYMPLEKASKLQAMVRLAQSLLLHIPRVLSCSVRENPEVRYGITMRSGSTHPVIPASLSEDLFHDLLLPKL